MQISRAHSAEGLARGTRTRPPRPKTVLPVTLTEPLVNTLGRIAGLRGKASLRWSQKLALNNLDPPSFGSKRRPLAHSTGGSGASGKLCSAGKGRWKRAAQHSSVICLAAHEDGIAVPKARSRGLASDLWTAHFESGSLRRNRYAPCMKKCHEGTV